MSKKVLIAEDEKSLAGAMSIKLKKAGFEVVTAYNGKEAIEAIQKNKLDLVLLDLIMPEVDGFGVLEQIKKDGNNKNLPIIILSNLNQPEDVKKAKDLGAKDFFVKSNISIEKIENIIEKYL